MLEQEPQRPIGEWLILDEAHAIKNRESRTYHSIAALRVQFHSCLMMTGTPLDNKWNDAYALISMIHGHPITSFLLFQAAFIQNLSSGPGFPEGFHRERHIQMLDACSRRLPRSTIEQEAQQYAYHPMLVELKCERDALARAMGRNEAIETLEDQAATDQLVNGRNDWSRTRTGSLVGSAFEAEPPHVILATRATGGQGLNLQCFNVVIQCGPWYERFRHHPKGPEYLQS
ncbi:CHD3-type chromatin-remodeling factor PICKLE [Fusarium circinatum]|uniref:CHD3-type chromatin-remodeling factor PICKLE n=1 Tax=Fusarium circinatum TaxID=48490 RepID=A0A8H5U9Y7_FUSCI|nr:CHD3-type chromatin-remodeling factor PICKLE [Fusarium circinatum]